MSVQQIITVALCTASSMHLRHIRNAAETLGVVINETRTINGFDIAATGPADRVEILRNLVEEYVDGFRKAVAERRRSILRDVFDRGRTRILA